MREKEEQNEIALAIQILQSDKNYMKVKIGKSGTKQCFSVLHRKRNGHNLGHLEQVNLGKAMALLLEGTILKNTTGNKKCHLILLRMIEAT